MTAAAVVRNSVSKVPVGELGWAVLGIFNYLHDVVREQAPQCLALACIAFTTSVTRICWDIDSVIASKSSVNPETGCAHGMVVSRTPCAGHSIRGTTRAV